MIANDLALAEARLGNRHWRLNNLYHIIDKTGEKRLFAFNWAQEQLYQDMWYCNVILKARQLGISTYICLLFLDACLFNSNVSAGIIAHTREDAEHLFSKAKIAYDCLPSALKELRLVKTDNVRELEFSNGSSFRVGVSLRSSTFQYLHISEFGKICAKYPEKAREIITGSLNTIAPGQYVFIESTAEGREGAFYEICKRAIEMKAASIKLTPVDYRFHFYPWWRDPSYHLEVALPIPHELQQYFEKLQVNGIQLLGQQKSWYSSKRSVLGEDMLREFPSTAEEAFLASTEALFYGPQIVLARAENRFVNVPYDPSVKCYTAWDLGYADQTAIWIYQFVGKEIHLIDYIEDSCKPLPHYLELLSKKPYIYDKHFVPHDAAAKEYTTGLTRVEVARNLGFNFTVAKQLAVIEGIDAARAIFNRCWFDERKCSQGIRALSNYKKRWNARLGAWDDAPLHDSASHGADAFRILAITLQEAQRKGLTAQEIDRMRGEVLGLDAAGLRPGHPLFTGY